ncbi:putative transporter [Corynebacterium belfantii]|nr:hypothetical protein [Corynebacterium belfantii]SNW32802.1 putative transporter [Corynebacterium belfantii]
MSVTTGVWLLVLILVLAPVAGRIPMVALVAVMMVAISTFDWQSVHPRTLKFMSLSETAVMVVSTVATDNLAVGVIAGVVMTSLMFARRVAHLVRVERIAESDQVVRYRVMGQLFLGVVE